MIKPPFKSPVSNDYIFNESKVYKKIKKFRDLFNNEEDYEEGLKYYKFKNKKYILYGVIEIYNRLREILSGYKVWCKYILEDDYNYMVVEIREENKGDLMEEMKKLDEVFIVKELDVRSRDEDFNKFIF